MRLPPAYHSLSVTWVVVPRHHVDLALTVSFSRPGFWRIAASVSFSFSRLRSFSPSVM